MIVSSAVRNHRTLGVRTAIAAAVLGMVVVVPVVGSSRADATTPKLGAKCLNSERGRTTNTLSAARSGPRSRG